MDKGKCEEAKECGFNCEHEIANHVGKESTFVYPSPRKPGIVENPSLGTEFSLQTPEKISVALNMKSEEGEFELLERHKGIVELFDGINCSLRLLGLRKMSPIFQNIHRQVEVLTGRKFSYKHLAQLKYLLPEAIQIDKILVHDKETLCMKADMKIMLLSEVVEGHHEQSDYIALHQLFTSRLSNYFIAHPEACDIPKAMLPNPFDYSKESVLGDKVGGMPDVMSPELLSQLSETTPPEQLPPNVSVEDLSTTTESKLLSKSSHLHPSFSRHFSEKVVSEERTKLLACPAPLSYAVSCDLKNEDFKIAKTNDFIDASTEFDSGTNMDSNNDQAKECSSTTTKTSNAIDPLPTQLITPALYADLNACASPLCKLESSAKDFVIQTPVQSTPRRGIPGSDDNNKTIVSQKQQSSSKAAKRSLDFSFLEGDEPESLEALPDNIPQAVDCSSAVLPKVDEESRICRSDLMLKEISNYLPGLVSLIHNIFHSVNYSSITKEELVYKIIVNSLDFDERRQVEEQIETLEKQVPDWICKKLAPSGDILYSIKKMPDLNSVQSRVTSIYNC
ncbi:CDT1-like protein b [Mercurialis annua]|uniref:CDT1-like protein b n=1 Tax=Mercurialis annua TaxID=3986 RepID=UPI00215F54BB|nr:CDT1-like protein b [Mercurialis annua]